MVHVWQESSVEKFGAVHTKVMEAHKEEETTRGASLRELTQFFKEKDQHEGYAGLRRIANEDGTAVWTILKETEVTTKLEERTKERKQEEQRLREDLFSRAQYIQQVPAPSEMTNAISQEADAKLAAAEAARAVAEKTAAETMPAPTLPASPVKNMFKADQTPADFKVQLQQHEDYISAQMGVMDAISRHMLQHKSVTEEMKQVLAKQNVEMEALATENMKEIEEQRKRMKDQVGQLKGLRTKIQAAQGPGDECVIL